MDDIIKFLRDEGLSKTLLDALPCGLLLINRKGYVLAVNNIFENAFGVRNADVVSRKYGNVMGCLNTHDIDKGCGQSKHCKQCEIRSLSTAALSNNRVQKARIFIQLIIDGQVKDANLMLCAAPFIFNRKPLCLLILEDITNVGFIPISASKRDNWGIVGRSEKMIELFTDIRDVAQIDAPVLIQGESGVGKELAALALHKESTRSQKLFVPINCGALPEGLMESELFGHMKGSFTGAIYEKKGRFGIADGGTIFLDEISELNPAMQVKFLRVLENGTYEPVGSDQTIRVDVRIISATNRDLLKLVKKGDFREDLFYRICVLPMKIPPLRERKKDIPLLADHYLAKLSADNWRPKPVISNEALAILTNHNWPGNVRELKNVLQYAIVKCKKELVEPHHLPAVLSENTHLLSKKQYREPKLHGSDIHDALKLTKGNRSRAAKILGVSRSTLYRNLDKSKKIKNIVG